MLSTKTSESCTPRLYPWIEINTLRICHHLPGKGRAFLKLKKNEEFNDEKETCEDGMRQK